MPIDSSVGTVNLAITKSHRNDRTTECLAFGDGPSRTNPSFVPNGTGHLVFLHYLPMNRWALSAVPGGTKSKDNLLGHLTRYGDRDRDQFVVAADDDFELIAAFESAEFVSQGSTGLDEVLTDEKD